MNHVVFTFVNYSPNSIVASVRLAKFISETLDLPLLEKGHYIPEGLETLLIVNGAYSFAGAECLKTLGKAIETAHRIVWVQQDYTIIPPKSEGQAESPFRKAFRTRHERGMYPVDYWTTCEPYAREGRTRTGRYCGKGSHYVNWNVLTFNASAGTIPVRERVNRDRVIYYGSFRADRIHAFERYLLDPPFKLTISCPTEKFFYAGFCGPNIIQSKKLNRIEDIGEYGLGLYLEDRMSSKEFHSPANRFYEMLSVGLGMVFPPESVPMLQSAGIDVREFVVDSQSQINVDLAEEIATKQRQLWFGKAHEERCNLAARVRALWAKYAHLS